ncbi:MLO-like protein 10 [Coffea eugenioides]|uniref:MLO-like protein 10 n=1 Tax=Coffea eugenioides TaxID=49369 RepID=UPI000F607766|nr:MLO-like protein 10 [Coffea eugenioides]
MYKALLQTNLTIFNKGRVPLISVDGLHQLHILIFFLAVFHVIYSAVTMALGRLKIRGSKDWEQETSSHHYEFSNDPTRFRLTHETSFVRAHTSFWTSIPIFFYIGCFVRQFFHSVSKSDYLTLRNGFISVHLAPGSKFNFQKYIKRSLEDDFKTVVGVSPVLWASFVVFLLLNVSGWKALFWASLIPVVIILAVGTTSYYSTGKSLPQNGKTLDCGLGWQQSVLKANKETCMKEPYQPCCKRKMIK